MKKYLLIALLISFLFSCKKDDDNTTIPPSGNASVSGKAEKGPFKSGSEIIIYELNNDLTQTGNSFSTSTINDAGNYSFSNINISSSFVEITSTGYYYMEHFNLIAPYRICLEALSEFQSGKTININLLTHLIKPRIEKLVHDGSSFTSAKIQAQDELKTFLHVPSSDSIDFEKLSIVNSNFLFGTSLIFQNKTVRYDATHNYQYEFNDLMYKFRSDFKDNGQIDSQEIIDTLLFNANRIELIDAKTYMENYMSSLGNTTLLSGYEQNIYAFQRAYSPYIYTNTYFPDSAIWAIEPLVPSMKRNMLPDTAIHFLTDNGGIQYQYLLTAMVPFDSSLVIKFTGFTVDTVTHLDTWNLNNYYFYGWKQTLIPHGFIIKAQRKNYPNATMMGLWRTQAPIDSGQFEYFHNNEPTPYFSKIIYWQ